MCGSNFYGSDIKYIFHCFVSRPGKRGWGTIDVEDLIMPENRSLEAINITIYNYDFFNSTSEIKRSSSSNQRYVLDLKVAQVIFNEIDPASRHCLL